MTNPKFRDYFHNADEIYQLSAERLASRVNFAKYPKPVHHIMERMMHAVADEYLADEIRITPEFPAIASKLLHDNCRIYCDSGMVKAGIIHGKNEKIFIYHDSRTLELSQKIGRTRSAAQVDYWLEMDKNHLNNAIIVIGNAPTVLFRLLELMQQNPLIRPAALIAVPVGFVGAESAKEYLIATHNPPPFVTLLGNRGGTPIACAALNAVYEGKGLA